MKLSQALGIDVEFRQFSRRVCGVSVPGPCPGIALNHTILHTRSRFTWAHEVYHILDPHASERHCDTFAAELLMPASLFRSALAAYNHRPPRCRIAALCHLFGVSRHAVLRRLEELQ